GDGANQHPTQTLLDLHTIRKDFGRTGNLRIALAGDLKYGRTVHSLFQALLSFPGNEFLLVSPPTLRLPEYLQEEARARKIPVHETTDLETAIRTSDIVYMTRIQRERFPDVLDYEKVKDSFRIDRSMLEGAPETLRILHPLPRVNEISPEVDGTVHAGYFRQMYNGMIMRQAILLKLLGVEA
ncbi:MAG: aspartate carbamoyltransferase, partial [Deltaproteobacteria bacterium]|nr:aspartate carbamoyltransferase [Deltaproteobacteria bacterium]